MTSLANKYFAKGVASEQNLLQNITTEAIQILGHTMYYLPRQLNKLDNIFGEDVLSSFDIALPIEVFISNFNQWEGNQELISKFGLEIQKQMILTMSRDRWECESKKIKDKMWVFSRPQEGDLIYEPMTKALMEIKFVDHDDAFYQLSKNYRYKLTCELFRYNQEAITTGNLDIDMFSSIDILNNQLLNEDGTLLLNEDGSSIINNTDDGDNERKDNTDSFTSESILIDFSADNPFNE